MLYTWGKKKPLKVSAAESPYSYLKGVHYIRDVKWDFFSPPFGRADAVRRRRPFPLRSFLLPSAPLSVPLPLSPPLPGCRINVRIMKTEYRSRGRSDWKWGFKKTEEMRMEVLSCSKHCACSWSGVESEHWEPSEKMCPFYPLNSEFLHVVFNFCCSFSYFYTLMRGGH